MCGQFAAHAQGLLVQLLLALRQLPEAYLERMGKNSLLKDSFDSC